jgi:hypothetical protein
MYVSVSCVRVSALCRHDTNGSFPSRSCMHADVHTCHWRLHMFRSLNNIVSLSKLYRLAYMYACASVCINVE